MSDISLNFAPALPWELFAILAALALALTLMGLFARQRGSVLRGLGFALLLLALANPTLVRENRKPLHEVVAVVVDQSGSQTIGERMAQTQKAQAVVQQGLDTLGNIDTRVIISGQRGSDAEGTQLFKSLSQGLADVPTERIGGVIMITDGIVHDIPASLAAFGIKAPLHALITGHPGERDRRIELIEAPRFGIVGKDLMIGARVLDTSSDGTPAMLHVLKDGVPVATVSAPVGGKIEIPVRIDHGGPNVIELLVDALPGELTTLNNHAVLTVDGVRDKLKVLLVSGEPHAGERMWRNLLKSDPNIDLVHFTILRPPEKNDGTPVNQLALIAFPVNDLFGTKIKDFDLIIFDRYSNLNILPQVYLENIVQYVRAGGALLLAAGPEFAMANSLFYTPLGDISPASPDGKTLDGAFQVTISKDGARHPVTRDLPGAGLGPAQWSDWYRQIEAKLTRGNAVLNGEGSKPLLVLAHEQKGRVALLLSDQMWLWARDYHGGGPYLELLRRLAHWLMKEPELDEEALRATARDHVITLERQSLKDSVGAITLHAPSGLTQVVQPKSAKDGLWTATIEASEPGLYHLTEDKLTALVNVGENNPLEFQDVVSSPDKLAPLAALSGGSVRRLSQDASGAIVMPRLVAMRDSPSYAGSDFIGIRRTGASTLESIGISPLAIGFFGLIALLGSVLLTWYWEGRRNTIYARQD